MFKTKVVLPIICIVAGSVAFPANIVSEQYYNCPNVINYSKSSCLYADVCASYNAINSVIDLRSEYPSCQEYYQETCGQVNNDFKNGKCTPKDRYFVKTSYASSTCTVDYVTKPSPRIVGQNSGSIQKGHFHSGTTPVTTDDKKCLQSLENYLKNKYPNIKPNTDEGIDVF